MAETILLTGFGPFGDHATNVSGEAARRLDGAERRGFRVRALELPVQFEEAVALLEEAFDPEPPAAVICCGIHSGEPATAFRVEVAARNERHYAIPDAAGHLVQDGVVEDGGPAQVISTLPVAAINQAWRRTGLESELSDDAGRYLCNAIFYWAARRAATAGFLHVPADPAGVEQVLGALDAALDVTAERLLAQRVEATA
jgi:pyroglutamyl-peptidase